MSRGVSYPSIPLVTLPFTSTYKSLGPSFPSPFSSVNPASITSSHPSLSESRSKQLTIPSPSVSISQPSSSSSIPSLSESKSIKSGTWSSSVSLIGSTFTFAQLEYTIVSQAKAGVESFTL